MGMGREEEGGGGRKREGGSRCSGLCVFIYFSPRSDPYHPFLRFAADKAMANCQLNSINEMPIQAII